MRPLDGVALCRVGEARLAFPCDEIDGIAPAEPGAFDAAEAFGEGPAPAGRALVHRGRHLRVDSIDVLAKEALAVLPVPLVLSGTAGGALAGFVVLAGALWPLVSVGALLDFLEGRPR